MTDEACIDYFNMGPWPMYLGFTQSKKAFAKEMKRLSVVNVSFLSSDHANATVHILEKDGALTCIIAMEKGKGRSPEQIAGLIAHEAMHIVQELWSHIGEKVPGREAEAYLIQHIVQSCLQIACDTGRTKKTEP